MRRIGLGVGSEEMRLLHQNLGSREIVIPILTALASISTLITTGGGPYGKVYKYQDQEH